MTRILKAPALLVLPLLLLAGCASSGGPDLPDTSYDDQLGRQVLSTLREAIDKVLLQQHGYRIQRTEEMYSSLLYETIWVSRTPSAEQRTEGVTDLRHRIVIEGRRVGDDAGTGGAIYRVTFEAQNEARTQANSAWARFPVDQEFRNDMAQIVTDLNLELRTGVRR